MNKELRNFLSMSVLIIFSLSVIRTACGPTTVTIPAPKPPDCVNLHDIKYWSYYYRYMPNFEIFFNGNGQKFADAFLTRGGMNPTRIEKGQSPYDSMFVPYPGGFNEMQTLIGTYWYNNGGGSVTVGWTCGIDEVRGITDPGYIDAIGLSQYHDYSYVLRGKMQRLAEYQQDTALFVEACLTHELAHQIKLTNYAHDFGHSGNFAGNCIMHSPLVANLVSPTIEFCDNHLCTLYAFINTQNLGVNNGSIGGQKETLNSNLEVNISFPKEKYLEAEEMFLELQITNKGNEEDSIKNLGPSGLASGLHITDQNGNKLNYNIEKPLTYQDPYYRIKAGEIKTFQIELSTYFGNVKNNVLVYGKKYEFAPGYYTVMFSSNEEEFGKVINSNARLVQVERAEETDSKAITELREIYTKPPSMEQAALLRSFSYTYPSSVYMDQAFYFYILEIINNEEFHKGTLNVDKFAKDCKWFIDKRPDSYHSDAIIINCAQSLRKKSGEQAYKNFIQEILTKYPNTKAYQVVDSYMNSKQK